MKNLVYDFFLVSSISSTILYMSRITFLVSSTPITSTILEVSKIEILKDSLSIFLMSSLSSYRLLKDYCLLSYRLKYLFGKVTIYTSDSSVAAIPHNDQM